MMGSTDGPFTNATRSRLKVLGTLLNPTDVIAAKNVYGQSPHLKGADAIVWPLSDDEEESVRTGMVVELNSPDAPIVSVGIASPFPTPRDKLPDPAKGFHWNVFNNIWNTVRILNLKLLANVVSAGTRKA